MRVLGSINEQIKASNPYIFAPPFPVPDKPKSSKRFRIGM